MLARELIRQIDQIDFRKSRLLDRKKTAYQLTCMVGIEVCMFDFTPLREHILRELACRGGKDGKDEADDKGDVGDMSDTARRRCG